MNNVSRKGIFIRIVVALVFGIIIWNFVIYLSDLFLGEEYHPLGRLILALVTTLLTLILLRGLLKADKKSWNIIGQSTVKRNLSSFVLGLLIFLIPAAIGLFICLQLGVAKITFQTDFSSLILSVFILFITVFFMEALPEELFFRGYIYRYLNALFPHWATIIFQTIVFTLFAYFIGAIYSAEQLQFIPGFAIILGIFRAISGNVWTSIGFHVAIMTATQILAPVHGHFAVEGMFTLQFIAYILLPSTVGAIVLSFMYSNFKWSEKELLS